MTELERTQPVPVHARRLGSYLLEERLGEGGMGVVWRARADDGRVVAVKVLREHIAHDDQARARLRREVSTLARVHHPRVAAVIDADVDGPAPYIVTEHVPGPPLDQVVAERGPLEGEELLRLGRGLVEALRAIHAAGIVHRDLKPGNVLLVRRDGLLDPVVIDFGIAHVADDVRLTSTGLVMGTPGYLSPEVVEGGRVGQATDWWGWAATLAFAASGEPPFGRGPMTVVLDRVVRGRTRLEGVDPELRPLLAAALDPDPARRPSQAQVLDGLERYARHEDVTGALPATGASVDATRAVMAPDATRAHRPTDTRLAPAREPQPTRVAPERPVWREPRPMPEPRADQPGPVAPYAFTAPPRREPAEREPARREPAVYPPPGGTPYPQGSGATAAPAPQGDPRIGRSRRTGTLLAMLAAFVGLATAAPVLAWGAYAVWAVLARTVDASLTSLVLRRHEAGRRRSDVPMLVAASPFHLLGGLLGTLLGLLLPVAVAGVVALTVAGVLTGTQTLAGVGPDHPLAVGAGSLVGAWIGWWGPASTSLRRGSRTLVRSLVPRGIATSLVVTLLVVGGIALAGWTVLESPVVSWWPMGPGFDPRSWLPGGLPF